MSNTSVAKNKLAELALDAMQDTYFVFDPATGQAIAWNRAFREICGYSDEEIMNLKAPDSYYSNKDLILAKEASKEVTSQGNINFQMSLISKDRRIHLFEYSGSEMDDPLSGSKWIVSIGRNISENKKIEQRLRQNQIIYDKTSQISRIGTWELNLDDSTLTWSAVTKEIHGVESDYEPKLEAAISFYKEGESRDKITQVVAAAIENGTPYDVELQLITAKKKLKWVRTIGIAEQKNGKIERLYGIFQDLTQQKTTQQALEESEEKYRTLIEKSDDAILTLDKKGVLSCNQATVELFGCTSKKEFLSKHPKNLSPKFQNDGTESRIGADQMIDIARDKGRNFFEWTHSRMDGTTFPVETLLTPMKIEGKEVVQAVVRNISKRKKIEVELRKSEEKYKDLYDNAPIMYISMDMKGKILECNKTILEILGYSKQEFVGSYTSTYLPQESADKFKIDFPKLMKKGELFDLERQFISKNGKIIDMLMSVSLDFDLNGDPRSTRATFINVSERKIADEKITRSEELYRDLYESIPMGYFVVDNKGRILSCNHQAKKLLGYSQKKLKGFSVIDLYMDSPFGKEKAKKINKRVALGETITGEEMQMINSKGMPLWVSLNIQPAKGQHPRRGLIQNITARKEVEESLRKSNERWQLAMEGSHDGVWDWNVLTGQVYYSSQWEEMLGYESGELEQSLETMSKLVHPEDIDGMYGEVNRYFKKETPKYSYELRMIRKDGSLLWTRHTASAIFDEKGNPVRMIGSTADITDNKLAEESIKESLEEKEILLKEIHHRVKNNLQIIWGLLDIQEKRTENDKIKSALLDSKGRVNTMALIHEDLYRGGNFSNIDLGVYIGKLVRNTQSIYLIPGLHVEVHNYIKATRLGLDVITPLALIINELIGNVYKHAFKGLKKGSIKISLEQRKKQSILTIVDNGIGLPPDFDLKKTNSLGLKLVQNLCRQLDAELSLKSEIGKGTQVKIAFYEKD